MTSEFQKKLAKSLAIDLTGDNFRIAAARLYEAIWPAIEIRESEHPASDKQIAFARDVGVDVSGLDRTTASCRITEQLDWRQAIEHILDWITMRHDQVKFQKRKLDASWFDVANGRFCQRALIRCRTSRRSQRRLTQPALEQS